MVISHRWIESKHPDPDNNQFNEIKDFLTNSQEYDSVFYDFSCMPQFPRSVQEEKQFKEMLNKMNRLYRFNTVFITRGGCETYSQRAWCFCEWFLSLGNQIGFKPDFADFNKHKMVIDKINLNISSIILKIKFLMILCLLNLVLIIIVFQFNSLVGGLLIIPFIFLQLYTSVRSGMFDPDVLERKDDAYTYKRLIIPFFYLTTLVEREENLIKYYKLWSCVFGELIEFRHFVINLNVTQPTDKDIVLSKMI